MELDKRIAALEARIDKQESKRRALRNEFIALQLVMLKLLPIISTSPTAGFDAAIEAAKREASTALLIAGFDAPDRADVLEAMDLLRDDLVGATPLTPGAFWH